MGGRASQSHALLNWGGKRVVRQKAAVTPTKDGGLIFYAASKSFNSQTRLVTLASIEGMCFSSRHIEGYTLNARTPASHNILAGVLDNNSAHPY